MNATQEIKVDGVRQEITGWKRYISFTYDGNQYEAILHWDSDGYELFFTSENGVAYQGLWNMPDWAENWDETKHDGQYLNWYLDDLTFEMEGVK